MPQGKVNMLVNMKEEQRLDMLKVVAGTSLYDDRRSEVRPRARPPSRSRAIRVWCAQSFSARRAAPANRA